MQPQTTCTPIFNLQNIVVGLAWDTHNYQGVDLDASCFVFDNLGNVIDVIYYNQLASRDGSIIHSGDEKTGLKEGLDEMVTFHPLAAHPIVHYLIFVITVHSAHTLQHLETATCSCWDGAGFQIANYNIGSGGQNKAMIMSMVAKIQGVWYFYSIGQPCLASSLNTIIPDLDKALSLVIPPDVLRLRTVRDVHVNLSKGDEFAVTTTSLFMGLGWEAGGFDLDAWCYLVGKEGQNLGIVYFGEKNSRCGSVSLSGDNRTGEGDGDDEVMKVELTRVPPNVQHLFFVVKIYTEKITFNHVKHTFVRIVDSYFGKELCRFKPKSVAGDSNAIVVGALHRTVEGGWNFTAVGLPAKKEAINSQFLYFMLSSLQKDSARTWGMKFLVVGDSNVGKTSLIASYVGGVFSADYRATIGVHFSTKAISWDARTNINLQLWDIAGQDRFASVTGAFYRDSVAAFVVCEAGNDRTLEGAKLWKKDLDEKVRHPETGQPIPIVLCVNKIDLILDVDERQALRARVNEVAINFGFFTWFETSAKDLYGIDDATRALLRRVIELKGDEKEEYHEPVKKGIVLGQSSYPQQHHQQDDCAC